MTNREAIKQLKKCKSFHNGSYGAAINLAIKALETQSCDCVRRKDVIILIDEATELHPYKVIGDSETYSNYNQGWEDACNWLYANVESDNLKTATPKARWIPVSEKLPEEGEPILFSTKTGRVYEGAYFDLIDNRQWYAYKDENYAWNNVVTTWMPLPQPYKAESEVQE